MPSRAVFVWDEETVRYAGVLGVWVYACLGLASVVHLATLGTAPSGLPWHVLDLAYGWWIAISFLLLQFGLGRRLFGAWLETAFGAAESATLWLAQMTAGFWITTVALMLLAWFDLLDWPWLLLYIVGSAFAVLLPTRVDWSSLRNRIIPPADRKTMTVLVLAFAVLVIWLPFLVQSLLPNSDWDGASTHLPLGNWLRTQGLAPVPLDHASLLAPGNVHLVYAMFQAIRAEQAVIPLNLLTSVLTCLAAAAIAARFWNSKAGTWAFFVCLSVNLVLELGLDPRIDGFLGLYCTVAALGIMVWFLEGWKNGALVVAAMALGMALGTKHSAVIPVVLWGMPIAWSLLREPESRKGGRKSAVVMALFCIIVPGGYWYASNTVRFGDPIYPLLGGDLVELKDGSLVGLADALDGLIATERATPEFKNALAQTTATPPAIEPPRTLFNPRSLFLDPGLHARKTAHTLSPLLLAFFLLPLFHRDRASWLLLWLGLSAFLAIGARTGLIRYGLPFYPLFAAGAGAAISGFKARGWKIGWAAALVFVLAINLIGEWRKIQFRSSLNWLRGTQSQVEWLKTVGYNRTTVLPELISDMDTYNQRGVFPYDGAALLLGEGKLHLFPIEAIPDTSRTGHPWLATLIRNAGDIEASHRELWSRGVRYIVLNMGYFEWVRNNTRVDQEELVYGLFRLQQFRRAFGQVVFDKYGIYIIRLSPPSDESVPSDSSVPPGA